MTIFLSSNSTSGFIGKKSEMTQSNQRIPHSIHELFLKHEKRIQRTSMQPNCYALSHPSVVFFIKHLKQSLKIDQEYWTLGSTLVKFLKNGQVGPNTSNLGWSIGKWPSKPMMEGTKKITQALKWITNPIKIIIFIIFTVYWFTVMLYLTFVLGY